MTGNDRARKVIVRAGGLLASVCFGLAWAAGCGGGDGAASAGDAGSGKDATTGPTLDGGTGITDAATSVDAADAAPGCVGDRNLGVTETYPDAFFIQNGGRIYDVMSPPSTSQHAAKGDGVTDDTLALQDAWSFLKAQFLAHRSGNYGGGYVIYLPAGTYLVSDTIIYPGASLEAPTGYDWDDVVDVRFAGESREKSIVRLKDSSAGFADASHPKIVLAYQHPDTRFNNIAGGNALRNLTVDVGSGNPGAVGVFFQGANLTAMRNVLVKSEDGTGAYGFWFKIGSAQGDYHDLTVDGLSYGIFQNGTPTSTDSAGETDTSFEHVTLINQKVAAVSASAGLSARALCADETATGARGLDVHADGTQVVMLDSELKGDAGDAGAIVTTHVNEQSLFLRNVATRGYGNAVVQAAGTDAGVTLAGPDVTEWSSLPGVTLFDGGAPRTLGLPIVEEPLFAWGDPTADWADPDDYGAVADGGVDDTAAVQKALDSGKSVVVLRRGSYTLKSAINIPATVRRFDLMYADIGNASINVSEASTEPLLIERGGGYGTMTLAAVRPLVLHETGGRFVNTAASPTTPTTVFLENIANVGDSDGFVPAGSTLYARGLNDEDAPPSPGDFVASGGTLWIFNYKTENKAVVSLYAHGESTVEVFNGYVNCTVAPGTTSMVVNDRSLMSFIGFTNLGAGAWKTAIEEVRDGGTQSLPPAAFPPRNSSDILIPLYYGDAR